mmetsp:Transcript_43890/g.93947  ORF Transcript_43890/g.93947 Transcript_43890/m.93947 type:complete len:357 (-) Transcript_43890:170-1240(-)
MASVCLADRKALWLNSWLDSESDAVGDGGGYPAPATRAATRPNPTLFLDSHTPGMPAHRQRSFAQFLGLSGGGSVPKQRHFVSFGHKDQNQDQDQDQDQDQTLQQMDDDEQGEVSHYTEECRNPGEFKRVKVAICRDSENDRPSEEVLSALNDIRCSNELQDAVVVFEKKLFKGGLETEGEDNGGGSAHHKTPKDKHKHGKEEEGEFPHETEEILEDTVNVPDLIVSFGGPKCKDLKDSENVLVVEDPKTGSEKLAKAIAKKADHLQVEEIRRNHNALDETENGGENNENQQEDNQEGEGGGATTQEGSNTEKHKQEHKHEHKEEHKEEHEHEHHDKTKTESEKTKEEQHKHDHKH